MKRRQRGIRRTLATLLTLALCLGLLPGTVLAANDETQGAEEEAMTLSADDVGESDAEAEDESTPEEETSTVEENSETEDTGSEDEIKELAVSEEPEEADDEDEELDENEPKTLAAGDPIYLNGADGDDSNDGATADTAVATFDKAKELAASNSTSTIYVCGTVTYSSGESTIDGSVDGGDNLTLYRYEEDLSDVLILVEDGTLTLSNITIDDQQIAETEPMVKVDGADAVLNITDGTVIQNANENGSTQTVADHAAVCVRNGTLNMSGGLITNNTGKGDGGGVSLITAVNSNDVAVMNMSGGTVSYNSATYGGGIDLYGNSTLNMTGGTVTHNTATYEGGGIMVEQYATAIISGGYITYNTQTYRLGWGGGGIYVAENQSDSATAGQLYLYNVEIAYNSPLDDYDDAYTDRRASVACCQSGELFVHLTEGEVFHDNYDANTVTVYRDSGSAIFDLSPVMLGGYPYHWTDENGDELPLNELIDSHDGWFMARTAVSTEDGTVSGLDRCTTHICYNQAYGVGSAIATNGNVQIGLDDGDVSIAIEKHWTDVDQMEGVTLPDEVNVVVYSVDSEGNKTFVGYETLTAEEGWKKTIENLPKYDSDGSEFEYIVEESEESIHGWFSMVTGGKTESSGDDYYNDEDKTAKYEFTVTNTPIELLNLEKTVEGTTDTDEFEFKITLYEPGDTDDEGNLNYYPYKGDVSVAYTIDGQTTVDTLTFDEGEAYVTIPAAGSASLEIGDGMQWWIEEITEGADSTSYTIDDGEFEEGTSAEGMVGSANMTVSFTNIYDEDKPKDGNPDNSNPDKDKPRNGIPDNGNPNGGGTHGGTGAPKTGDTNNIALWLLLLAASAVTCGSGVYMKRHKNKAK